MVEEFDSFIKGGGKKLLLEIITRYKKVVLMANPTASGDLVDYYRQPVFKFKEYSIDSSVYDGKPLHFFYTAACDERKLIKTFNGYAKGK